MQPSPRIPPAPDANKAAHASRHWLSTTIGAVLFGAALWILRRELHQVSYHTLAADFAAVPALRVLAAALLTAANYLVLTGYDQLAFAYAGRRLARWRISLASFVAYAIANTVGFALLSGTSVRYRFYSRWGLGGAELSRVIVFYTSAFWLGLLTLGGAVLLLAPLPGVEALAGAAAARAAGAAMLLAAAAYAVLASQRGRTLRVRDLQLPAPGPLLVAGQFALSVVDWTLAAGALYALIPAGRVPPARLLGAFLAAQVLGLVSHVPGGLGVFETVMVILLRPFAGPATLLPALLLFRVVYYLLPLALALLVLAGDELYQRRRHVTRMGALFGSVADELAARLLAVFTFMAGAVLLFSGATPAAAGRLAWLNRFVPLPLIEFSHFAGSVIGVWLLLVSNALWRRLDAGFYLASFGLAAGMAASLAKGGDYEEALLLGLVLLALVRGRRRFVRRAAFFATRLAPEWIAGVLAVVVASVWLGFFAFKHVDYSHDLWWRFELKREASRFLRASVGTAMVLLVFGVARLLRTAPPEETLPGDEDLARAGRIIETQTATAPFLVYLRDKSLLFSPRGDAFLMYAVQGTTWVALGDPVGPAEAAPALIREFLERCRDYDGEPVFYEVRKDRLYQYADFGLTFVKLGEDAVVPLEGFSLDGARAKGFRRAINRLSREGCAFRVLEPAEVAARLPQLREVSDEWLAHRQAAEKGFSLGFFDPDYVRRFPAAVVERPGRVEAFANVWAGPQRVELSVDLMRYRIDAPLDVMEALLASLMMWGKAEGYRTFSLGMAPLSGIESSPAAALWMRLAHFLYQHGEVLYKFQGLRAYKEKFHPVWEPRYVAYAGGLSLARILADVAALIAGGYRRIFLK